MPCACLLACKSDGLAALLQCRCLLGGPCLLDNQQHASAIGSMTFVSVWCSYVPGSSHLEEATDCLGKFCSPIKGDGKMFLTMLLLPDMVVNNDATNCAKKSLSQPSSLAQAVTILPAVEETVISRRILLVNRTVWRRKSATSISLSGRAVNFRLAEWRALLY